MMWTEKHKPSSLQEIPQLSAQLLQQAAQQHKAIILHGPTGSGKTTAVYTLAKQQDYEVLEVNASDVRNKAGIENIVGEASQQMSLFMKKKLILVDEIDGVSGQADRGGIPTLKKIIEKTKFPVIMTCNDIEHQKFKDLKKKAFLIGFEKITPHETATILQKIMQKENLNISKDTLKHIIKISKGDLRAAINDLWISSTTQEEILLESRDTEDSLQEALKTIFEEQDFKITSGASMRANADLNEISSWIEENIFQEYKTLQEQEQALKYLAKADIFKSRIRRWQYWRFLVYQNILATAGVASVRTSKKRPVKYKRPSRGLKIFMANIKQAKKKARAEILSKNLHIPKRKILQDFNIYKVLLELPGIVESLQIPEDKKDLF